MKELPYIACALGNVAYRRFKKIAYIRMSELLDELTSARSNGELKKLLAHYKKVDLLILDEWLIRPLIPQESYDLLEIAEARSQRSMIFCTQYQTVGWYTRIDPNPEFDSPVSEAIMNRIIHNSYEILVEERISMCERKGLKLPCGKAVRAMAKCPYNPTSEYCEMEVQMEVAKVAENEAAEAFRKMDAEIRKLLQCIELLEKTLQRHDIPIPNVED